MLREFTNMGKIKNHKVTMYWTLSLPCKLPKCALVREIVAHSRFPHGDTSAITVPEEAGQSWDW